MLERIIQKYFFTIFEQEAETQRLKMRRMESEWRSKQGEKE